MTRVKDNHEAVLSAPKTDMTLEKTRLHLRAISYNIRYATKTPFKGEEPWSVRCPKLATQLKFLAAGQDSPFVCLQEVLYSQLLDIKSHLGDQWSHVGRGRSAAPADGEFSPILYRSDLWKLLKTETKWLSETPDRPSKGWDAALNRIVTIAKFTHKLTGTHVVIMSTHFDHIGVKAREESAKLLVQFSKDWGQDDPETSSVVLIGGDFNSTPLDKAYQTMISPDSGLSDIAHTLPEDQHFGNKLTFTGFDTKKDTPSRIDFLFIKEPRTAKIQSFGVLSNLFDDGIRISDHRPVVADMDIVA